MSHTAEPNNRCVMDAEPEAWLFEVRFEGRDEWSVYGVFRRKADADSLMRTAVMGLEGRLVPLYRPNAIVTGAEPAGGASGGRTG